MPRSVVLVCSAVLCLSLLSAVWVTLASSAFLWLAGLWWSHRIGAWSWPWQWLVYAHLLGRSFWEGVYLALSGIAASAPYALGVRYLLTRKGGLRLPFRANADKLLRGTSDNHGHADFMSVAEMQEVFPAVADPEVGGVVVGEAERVDLGPAAGVRFRPQDRRTWGNGGKAPLLIDTCSFGSTHSMVIGGGGTYKSTTLVTSLLTWRTGMFVLDPSTELADIVGKELSARGRKVVRLEIGGTGPNVLASVLDDIAAGSEMAETRIRAIVGRIVGPSAGGTKSDIFKDWGRSIILTFLAALLWSPTVPVEEKTLREMRQGLEGGSERVRNRLAGISRHSPSPLARSLASTLFDIVEETFSGALSNATEATAWLASSAYANLVCGDAYRMEELCQGNLAVFCQVPMEALQFTPAVARVLVGCHLDTVFAAKGKVKGRVYFPLDEAVLMGRDPSLVTARDQGRKCKITLQLFYQSEGQIEETWTPAGKQAWFDGLSWRTYAGVQNLKSAQELSATLGTFGALATSTGTNHGKSGKRMEIASSSKGTNQSEHEISRELVKPHEILSSMRADERLTLVRDCAPMRHGSAIAFRREDMRHLLEETTYRAPTTPQQAAE